MRSPYPMIPIGGIQMVHSIPTSVTTPLAQQGAQQAASRLVLQKSTSEESTTSEVAYSFSKRGRRAGVGGERVRESSSPHPSMKEKDGGGVRQEQEESIHTCTKAIASLCIDSEEHVERGGGAKGDDGRDGGRGPPSLSPPSVLSPDSQPPQQQRSPSISMSPPSPHPSPSPPQGPGIQHFSSLELRPLHHSIPTSPHSSSPSSPHPHSPGSDALQPPTASKPLKLERDREAGNTNRIKDVS